MINIPTDLLRTLITVVDLRSFTKAAQSLGVTQPAVSAQIKRLQYLLGADLLDKSAPGVSLTVTGELVVNYARRLLSINDQILHTANPRPRAQKVHLGVPTDVSDMLLAHVLADFRSQWDDVRFAVRSGSLDPLIRDLRQGELDVVVGLTPSAPAVEARHHWIEELVWVRSSATQLNPSGSVPLVAYGPNCTCYRVAASILNQAGRESDLVLSARSTSCLTAAVEAGVGTMVMPRNRVLPPKLSVWEDTPLPKLPDVFCGVYVRDGGDQEMLEQLAEALTAVLRPPVTSRLHAAVRPVTTATALGH